MTRGDRLTTAEAAARLGVKPATLYAYVSRGLLGRERSPGRRTSTFDPAEVERLTRRSGRRGRRPAGELVVESALTAIEGGALWYRGLPVTELAATRTFEEVAEWLWRGRFPEPTRWRAGPAALAAGRRAQAALPEGALPLERLQVIAAALAAGDDLRLELHPDAVAAAGRALIAGLAAACHGSAGHPRRTPASRHACGRASPRSSRARRCWPCSTPPSCSSPTTSLPPPRWRPGWRPRFAPTPTRSRRLASPR